MGTASVGSMVVFEQGVANKKLYRRFNIRGVEGPDDFASMEEVLRRRFNHYHTAQSEKDLPGKTPDLSFSILPDLLIVDGGKGQLGRAVKVISEQGLDGRFKLVGLAKQEEELFLPGQSNSVRLEERSQGLYLIQRIRDEAHRFAITAHRSRRGKIGLTSRLDAIPGLGPARRKELILRFGSIEAILVPSRKKSRASRASACSWRNKSRLNWSDMAKTVPGKHIPDRHGDSGSNHHPGDGAFHASILK